MRVSLAAAAAIVLVFITGSHLANGLTCRSGFNTSVYGIPIQFWDESANCSTASDQSCFAGEMTYNTSFFQDDLALTYGSCISTAYESSIACDELFGADGLNIDMILLMVPDLESQLNAAIDVFSNQAANQVMTFIKNENGQLDGVNVIESLFDGLNVTIPDNVKPVLTKLDSLLLTAVLNVSQASKAFDQFLTSFKDLSTPDAAASQLLLDVFERNKVNVSENFKPVIENFPGFIAKFVEEDPNFKVINATLYSVIANIDAGHPQSLANALPDILNGAVDSKYKLSPLFDSLPALVDELSKENYDYINTWNVNVMKQYSEITPATEALSNSTFELLRRFGVYDNLTEEFITLITYQPGYFYNFLTNNTVELESALFNISKILDSVDPNAKMDTNDLLQSFGNSVNFPGMEQIFSTLDGILRVAATGNLTALGKYSLQALEDSSTLTTESIAMSDSINTFLEKLNLTLKDEVRDIIKYLPGLFIASIPDTDNTNLINTIYMNISDNLEKLNFEFTNPNYGEIVKSAFSPFLMLNLTSEMRALFQQLPSQLNTSDPVGSLRGTIDLLTAVIPPEMSQILPVLKGLPELLDQILRGNYQYITTWQLAVLKSVSNVTPETEKLSTSIVDMSKRFGFYDDMTDEMKETIRFQPAFFYTVFPDDVSDVDSAVGNVTEIINSIYATKSPDLKRLMRLIPTDENFPGMNQLVESLDGFLDIPMAGDVLPVIPAILITVEDNKTILSNFTDDLVNADGSTPNFTVVIEFVLELLSSMNVTFSTEVQALLKELPSKINISDPIGSLQSSIDLIATIVPQEVNVTVSVLNTLPELLNQLLQNNFKYINTWQLEVLKAVGRVTPATVRLSNSIINLAKRYGFFANLTDEVKTVIMHQPGYFYWFFPNDVSGLEYAYGNMSAIIDSIDPKKPLDLKGILSLISPTLNFTGLDQLISTLDGFVSAAMTGDVTTIGMYGLEALKNSSTITAESTELSNSILGFLERMNITLPDEVKEIIINFPGIFTASFPSNVAMVNSIFSNISQSFNGAESSTPDINAAIKSTIQQLAMMNIILPAEIQILLNELPSKINFSDPVGSLQASIDLLEIMIPKELSATVSILNTLPELLSQLIQGNFIYFNTWQLELLKTASKITPATEQFSNSVFNLTKRLGVYENLTDEMKTAITYQPGYFYLFFQENPVDLENVLGNMSAVIDSVDLTKNTNLREIFSLISTMPRLPGMNQLLSTLDGFIYRMYKGDTWLDGLVIGGFESLQNYSSLTIESIGLTNSIMSFLERMNVTLDENIIKYIPGIFTTSFPDNITLINEIFSIIGKNLDSAVTTTTDLNTYFESTMQQLEKLNITLSFEVQTLLQELPSRINFSDPVGSLQNSIDLISTIFPQELNTTLHTLTTLPELLNQLLENNTEYFNTWQLELLKSNSRITPVTEMLSNSIFEMTKRFEVYSQLTYELQTLIMYQPGYFYLFFPEDVSALEYAYSTMSAIIDTIDPSKPIDLNVLLSVLPSDVTFSGMDQLVSTLEGFVNAAMTGNVSVISMYGLESLKNASTLTTESIALSNSIVSFFERMNLTLPIEVNNVFKYVPGIFISYFPDNVTLIDAIYFNISEGLDSADATTPDLSSTIDSTIQQLLMLNITFTEDVQDMLKDLPTKINFSDPVGTLQAILDIVNKILPEELNDTLPMLNSLPKLFSELYQNNIAYINSWQINLLKLYSKTTPATEAIKTSIIGLIERYGFYNLTDELTTLITYQPGYFYQFFMDNTIEIDNIFYNVSAVLDSIDPRNGPDLKALLKLFGINSNVPGMEIIIGAMEELLTATYTGNGTIILKTIAESMKNFSNPTQEGNELSKAIIQVIENMNVILSTDVKDIINYFPGIFTERFPNQTEMINLVYTSISKNIKDSMSIKPFNIEQILNDTLEQLKMANIALPSELMALVDQFPALFDAIVVNNKTQVDNLVTNMLPLLKALLKQINQSSLFDKLTPLLNSTEIWILAGTDPTINMETLFTHWMTYIHTHYCTSNDVTKYFAQDVSNILSQYNVGVSEDAKLGLECVPGSLYMAFPNQTEMLTDVFSQMKLAYTNYSSYVEAKFKELNASVPLELSVLLEKLPEMQVAFAQGNTSLILTLLQELQQGMAKETELSKLIITILTKAGVNLTEEIRMSIRQSSNSAYNPSWPQLFPTMNIIFSSLNDDIAADKDVGVAIKDAFAKADVSIYLTNSRLIPVLDNLQSLIDDVTAGNTKGINDDVLNILVAYNASFPSEQVQSSIYAYKLQLALMDMRAGSNIPDEAFEQVVNLYKLILKSANITEAELRSRLLTIFPDGKPFIEIFFQLDPKEAFSAVTNFAYWVFDANRNSTTLATYINATIHLLLDRHEINVAELLKTLVQPKSCQYEVCRTDNCNVRSILPTRTEETTTTKSDVTTAAATTGYETTSITTAPMTTTAAETTTSGHVINSQKAVSWTILLSSIIFSLNLFNL